MTVKQIRSEQEISVPGKLPHILTLRGEPYITTTLFVKFNYKETEVGSVLNSVTVAALPNGLLQDKYNPSHNDTMWLAGRNAPSLGEEFRVRLSFERLKSKASWRVQRIPMPPDVFNWDPGWPSQSPLLVSLSVRLLPSGFA